MERYTSPSIVHCKLPFQATEGLNHVGELGHIVAEPNVANEMPLEVEQMRFQGRASERCNITFNVDLKRRTCRHSEVSSCTEG